MVWSQFITRERQTLVNRGLVDRQICALWEIDERHMAHPGPNRGQTGFWLRQYMLGEIPGREVVERIGIKQGNEGEAMWAAYGFTDGPAGLIEESFLTSLSYLLQPAISSHFSRLKDEGKASINRLIKKLRAFLSTAQISNAV